METSVGIGSGEENVGAKEGGSVPEEEGSALQPNRLRNPRFHELLQRMAEVHDAKSADYASDDDHLTNLRACEKFGVPAWKGALIRLSDKWSRIEQLVSGKKPRVKDEAIEDTLLDFANYALLIIVLREEAKQ